MGADWLLLLVGFALAVGIWLRFSPVRNPRFGWVMLVVAIGGGALLAAKSWSERIQTARDQHDLSRVSVPREGRPGGFTTSAACKSCHPAEHDSWHKSFHRTMTQYPTAATVQAPFDNLPTMRVRGGDIQLERRPDDSYWMRTLPNADNPAKEYRIGLMTGSHHLQVFWIPDGRGNRLELMPYAYLIADKRWVPTRDTFLADPRLPFRFDTWNTQCVRCHATGGQPRPSEDGLALDTRTAEMGIACEACHGPAEEHVRANANPLRRYAVALAGKGDPTIVNPARLSPRLQSEACGQCHGLSGIADPKSFLQDGVGYRPGQPLDQVKPPILPGEPGSEAMLQQVLAEDPHYVESRFWPDGIVRVIGREWTALRKSTCHTKGGMTCLTCHSMHKSDPDDQLAENAGGDQPCLGCHKEIAARIEPHTHHAPASTGSSCQNCHMPYTTYGLLKATRSHFIDTPRVATTIGTGRPTACNLCHLDRTMLWTAEHLRDWYGHTVPENMTEAERTVAGSIVHALRGDAAQRALVAWAMGWKPARDASAVASLPQGGAPTTDKSAWLAGYLTLALGDTYSAVRKVAERSLRTMPGFADITYDYVADPEAIERAINGVIVRWGRLRKPLHDPELASRLMMRGDGSLDTRMVAALVSRRNELLLELKE